MKIYVVVKTRKKEEKVEKIDATHYFVFTKAVPVDGKANEAVIRILAEFFDLPKTQIRLITGKTSKKKIFII